jgi:hypothetical protein
MAPSPAPAVLPWMTLWERGNARRLFQLTLAVVAVGLLWRTVRYLLRFPIWGDEAMLLVNYLDRDYRGLLGPIDNCQIAPLLYHVAALAAFRNLGPGELALHLPSFVASVAALGLFWLLARLTLPPLARALAVAILAVSSWPVGMAALCKPYAFDLFFSLTLLLPAVAWLRSPGGLRYLTLLVVVTPVALVGSYPAVFVAGAAALVLLPAVWRSPEWTPKALYLLFVLLLGCTFLAHYLLVARVHLASPCRYGTTAAGMYSYWEEAFPPGRPLAFLKWFVLMNTGQAAAYPVGSANGGSILTVLLAALGIGWLWQRGQRQLVWLTAACFGLWFLAAVLHKYPYAGSGRLSQHAAPFYCLLAGLGGAALILRAPEATRWRCTALAAGLLGLVGLLGTVWDVLHPYRDEDALWARKVVGELFAGAEDDPILVLNPPGKEIHSCFHWQLGSRGGRVLWARDAGWHDGIGAATSLWTVLVDLPREAGAPVEEELAAGEWPWQLAECRPLLLCPKELRRPFVHCRICRWTRAGE